MSTINLEWLARNLPATATIFDIGCANMSSCIDIKLHIPNGKFHAFECAESWREWNMSEAAKHNINYHHLAVSDVDGYITFYPSEVLDGQEWPWSGSTCEPGSNLLNERWQWGQYYTVPSTTIATFCDLTNTKPDFIHIDVQGAEHKVFSSIGVYRPSIVWSEISEFHMYKTGTTYREFKLLMESLNYTERFRDDCDALYVLNGINVTEYEQNMPSLKMTKRVNFVFDWIGPQHPIPNNTVPNIMDLAYATGRATINKNPRELNAELQNSNCYNFLKPLKVVRTCTTSDLPEGQFLYEYNHYWWHSVEEFFGSGKLGGMLGWGQLPENVLDRIKNKTAYLLVTIPMESPLKDSHLNIIENYFRSSDLPISQVIYLTCSPNCQEVYDNYCHRMNKPNEGLRFEYLPFYFYEYKDIIQNKEVEYTIGPKSKTFLMFNRRWGSQPHRVLMLAYIYKNNLLDEFNISFSKLEIDNGGTYTEHARQFFNSICTPNIITDEDLASIEERLPLILDTCDHKLNLMFDEFEFTTKFYEDSLVNLIAETNFFTNIVHLTEKSYKPIVYKQPFVMLGSAGSLRALRDQGFQTFEKYWDESYDNELDNTKRFFKVLDIIKDVCSWSPERKHQFNIEVKSIVDYNYQQLQQGYSQLVINFVDKYGA